MNEIETYINDFPIEVQEKLYEIRKIIFEEVPEATERISFNMPTYELEGKKIIYFAGFKKHIGLYPFPDAVEDFRDKLADYKTSVGTIQLPLNKSIPADLIREIIKYRINKL